MPKTIQNGGFTNPLGTALTGNLLLILSQDAKAAASPNQVAPIATRIPIAAGNIAPTSIYFNDELLPNNTYYTMTAYDAAGNKVYGPEIASFTGAGPLDLGTLTPLLISPDPLFSNPVLQNPSTAQTIAGQSLTLASTAPLTVQSSATFTGAALVTGSLVAGRIGGFRYVDTTNTFGWAGATPDAWITSAINDLPSTGGTVYLGPGVFSFAAGITISKPNVVLVGSGSLRSGSIGNPGATVLRGGAFAAPVITIAATAWNVRLYHMQFDNEGGSNLSTHAVQLIGGAFHFVMESVSVGATQKFTTAGFQTTNAAISAFIVLRDCFFNGAAPINIDIDDANGVIFDHTASIGNANTSSGAVRFGATSLVTGIWIGNGSDIEIGSGSGNTGYCIQLNKTANTVIRDSFLETNITSTSGTEGQLAIMWNSSSSNQTIIEGNYFQGNVHTNYAVATNSFSPSNIYINQNEFNAFLLAGLNPSSTQTRVIIGDNYFAGGTPVGAFTPALQWVDSSGQFNFGKPISLNGSTSGAVSHAVPATVTSYTETDPATAPTVANAVKQYTTGGVASFSASPGSLTVASGTSTLTANATLGAVTSQAAITTTATGAATTDSIEWAYATAPGAGDSLCTVSAYVTANNVNFVRSNPTAAAQNVSALVINWRVVR